MLTIRDAGILFPDLNYNVICKILCGGKGKAMGKYKNDFDDVFNSVNEDMPEMEPLIPKHSGKKKKKRNRKKERTRKIILISLIAAASIALVLVAVWMVKIFSKPQSLFETASSVSASPAVDIMLLTPTPGQSAAPSETPEPTPDVTEDPYALLSQEADMSMLDDIVNVMLIGVDYAEERTTWKGKDGLTASHADVMIVLSINFKNNTANMISLPRDTYAKIPNVDGIYKLNAALDCGGGLNAKNGAGFVKVCEAASRMIGGIPINYYYAVTMPAVKELVDSIGGVDYDLDISFTLNKRTYKKGMQHMDGQAVLDYLRVRKAQSGLSSSQTGDSNRVNRQKKMLVAIFEKIKKENLMSSIPNLIHTFSGQLFTNCSLSQTAALAYSGLSMPSENISLYSMSGHTENLYTWNFCFPDPSNRRQLIRKIYGVEASDLLDCTKEYATWEYRSTVAEQYLDTCERLTDHLQSVVPDGNYYMSAEARFPAAETVSLSTASILPRSVRTAMNRKLLPGSILLDEDDVIPVVDGGGNADIPPVNDNVNDDPVVVVDDTPQDPVDWYPQQDSSPYSSEEMELYNQYMSAYAYLDETLRSSRSYAKKYLKNGSGDELESYADDLQSACDTLQSLAINTASVFGYSRSLEWDITPLADRNEIWVDFR